MRTYRHRTALLSLVVLVGLLAGGLAGALRAPTAQAAGVPAGLPNHFGLGVAAGADQTGIYGWMPNSGVPWDYAYQYLVGGVNTGAGWETWNPNGQYALSYAQGSDSHHYIPVFDYYEVLQSNGACNSCPEDQRDIANLNNASLMASYYQNFTLLMQRLSSNSYGGVQGYGKTAIVHVEGDLSGYANHAVLDNSQCFGQCTGQGNNPAYLKTVVAGSGNADVAAYPNTYQGFNWALLHLRDKYAPNVLLSIHLSNWATGQDIGSSSDPSLDAAAMGQAAGQFVAQAGVSQAPAGTSTYDMVFNDPLDRDAAYYKYVFGDSSKWWDRLNVTFPNFHRWEAYLGGVHQATGKPLMVWQIPEGNQYYDSENNTNGHYQDNRAEYFFGHLAELEQAGIIGLMFGPGNGGSTAHTDTMGDGVTNPAAFCTTDGLSSGQICNTHPSSYADDDGGYLRLQAQAYYASGGLPLGGATPTPTATARATATATATPSATATTGPSSNPSFTDATSASPVSVAPGAAVTLRATVTDTGGAMSNGNVDIEVYNSVQQRVGQQTFGGQNFAPRQSIGYSYIWTAPNATGAYTVTVGVFSSSWATDYSWDGNAAALTVQASAPTATATATPKATATATATPKPTATATAATQTTARLGYPTAGGQTDSGDANYMNGSRFTTGSTGGTVTSMSVYVATVDAAPNNHFALAINTDNNGTPGALVARSGIGTLTGNAWNTLSVSATISANTGYWLLYNTDGSNGNVNNMRYDSSNTVPYAYSANPTSFGAWPTSFGQAVINTAAYSLYATYTH